MTPEQLAAAGYDLDPATHARLARFVELLLEENRRVNLTAIRDPAAVWPLHVCDSLAMRPFVVAGGCQSLLDLGCGGGIPGVPLAIAMPSLGVTLLDATRKKADAMKRIIAALGWSEPGCPQPGPDRYEDTPAPTESGATSRVLALWGRAETAAHNASLRERFDGLTARGVAPLPVLVELAAAFIRIGGRCWFSKSCGIDDEIAAARAAAARCGLALVGRHEYDLPPPHGRRLIVEYEKVRPTPAELPRRPGVPTHRPLSR